MSMFKIAGSEASRSAILKSLPDAECVHLTVPVLWDSANVALSVNPCEEPNETPEYLLSMTDISKLRLTARLVVISGGHYWNGGCGGESDATFQSNVTVDGVENISKTFLNSGAQCVLIGLWPVPPAAGSILLRAFYSAMLQGAQASRALAEAMQTVQHTRHFAHPINWAGWLLLGSDSRLSNKV